MCLFNSWFSSVLFFRHTFLYSLSVDKGYEATTNEFELRERLLAMTYGFGRSVCVCIVAGQLSMRYEGLGITWYQF